MPRQPASTGLFGQTPQAIRQAQINERINQASMIGNLGPGGHGALAGGMFGRAAGNALGLLAGQDVSDPRLQQAQAMQEIEAQITQMGLEPGTREFTETLGQLATMRLGVGAAAPIVRKAQQLEMERAEIEAVRNPPSVAAAQNRFQALIQVAQMSPGAAEVIAPMKEVSEAVLKGVLSPKEMDAMIERALFAENGDIPKARRRVAKAMEGRPLVSINNEGKLQQITDETRARARAKGDVATEMSLEKAGPTLRAYIKKLEAKPPLTDVAGLAQWAVEVSAMRPITQQALARLNNPERVTDDDIRAAGEQLPGPVDWSTGRGKAQVKQMEVATKLRLLEGDTSAPGVPNQQQIRDALNLPPGAKIISIERVK